MGVKNTSARLGNIYVLSNPAMPGIVKIGYTEKKASDRAAELSLSTSVPLPFVVEYEQLVETPSNFESMVHGKLARYRISNDREFFRISADEAETVIRQTLFGSEKLDVEKEISHLTRLYRKYPNRFKQAEQLISSMEKAVAGFTERKKG